MDDLDKLFGVDLDTPAYHRRPVAGPHERLIGLREIAVYLQVGRSWLIEHIKGGDLIAYRIGGVWRVSRMELHRFLLSNRSDRIARGPQGAVMKDSGK